MFRAPRTANLPHLQSLMNNIGHAPDAVARFLELSPSTICRYIKDGQAPKPVMLALYWESSWGLGHVNADAVNNARRYYSEATILRRKICLLEQQIQALEAERDGRHIAANSPVFLKR